MPYRRIAIAVLLCLLGFACAVSSPIKLRMEAARPSLAAISTQTQAQTTEQDWQQRGLALREKLAATDLQQMDLWWRQAKVGDPHKYILPIILARLSLPERYDSQPLWDSWTEMNQAVPALYHFRSVFDVRLFFQFRRRLPLEIEMAFQKMLKSPQVKAWSDQGTENHMFMQRMSGLALMDGSGLPYDNPAIAATNEAWLRSELTKFLTIGQGEFHSSTYYGFSISSLLNLYDFAQTPELKKLAKATLDWFATNMALRLSWGTLGGAESRGFDRGTWGGAEATALAWLWWGNNVQDIQQIPARNLRSAINAALSTYRPPQAMTAIARKQVPLPFELKASHPGYYSYHRDNQFWESFYITPDYSLGTLLVPGRSYQVKGTINAQYATYKLVIRDPAGRANSVVRLGGTFHGATVQGASPGDQYVQKQGTVLYQLRLTEQDQAAGVPARSHLVLPQQSGAPRKHGDWYIWKIEQTWLCARAWGDTIQLERSKDDQVLVAQGNHTAWITDVVRVADYPNWEKLIQALDRTQIDDRQWTQQGRLRYRSLAGDQLEMEYRSDRGVAQATINGRPRILENWDVLDSPYVIEKLRQGTLTLQVPGQPQWSLSITPQGIQP